MPTLADVFRVIHSLKTEGIIENYAIGGTVAALFYAEATLCFELHVCTLGLSGYWVVYGVPLRFVEPQELEREAVETANTFSYNGVSIRVMSAEHLIAFYLRDRKSLLGYPPSYFAPEKVNRKKLETILECADLLAQWRTWKEQEETESPDAHRYASKKRWHEQNALVPVEEKMAQLIQIQKHDLPLLAKHRELKWWEKPWDIEP